MPQIRSVPHVLNSEDLQVREIIRVTWWGVLTNISLSLIKFILGFLGHSQALIADAAHSLSDLSTDFAVILGARVWTKPADEDHPYGHRRIETIITLSISLFLLAFALVIGFNALATLHLEEKQQPGLIAFWGALISIVLKELLYHVTLRVGKRVKSSAVIANAWHHRTDALSSLPVAVAVAVAAVNPRWSFLDQLGAFVVALIILHVSLRMLWEAFREMADTGASQKTRQAITSVVLSTEGVRSLHALRTRRVGSGWHVDLHIQVDPQLTVKEGHDISERVKTNLKSQDLDISDVLIHLEPYEE